MQKDDVHNSQLLLFVLFLLFLTNHVFLKRKSKIAVSVYHGVSAPIVLSKLTYAYRDNAWCLFSCSFLSAEQNLLVRFCSKTYILLDIKIHLIWWQTRVKLFLKLRIILSSNGKQLPFLEMIKPFFGKPNMFSGILKQLGGVYWIPNNQWYLGVLALLIFIFLPVSLLHKTVFLDFLLVLLKYNIYKLIDFLWKS